MITIPCEEDGPIQIDRFDDFIEIEQDGDVIVVPLDAISALIEALQKITQEN